MTRALLFDMDGVLVDTEKVHEAARLAVYRKHGIDYDKVRDIPVIGRNTDAIFEEVNARIPFPVPLAQAIREKRDIFVTMLKEPISPLPGVKDLLARYRGKLMTGLVSASARQNIDAVMKNTGLYVYFDGIICAEDVRFFKPDPESYLLGARKLGVDPGECVVFEDSRIGVLAARNAGARVVGVMTGHAPDNLALADLTVTDLAAGRKQIEQFIGV
jgi:HAD superfamily hydrolase (TIGR01509 family)